MLNREQRRAMPVGYAFCNVNPDSLRNRFVESLYGMQQWDAENGGCFGKHGMKATLVSGARLARARCDVMQMVLDAMAVKNIEWIAWADSDMGWHPTAFHELIASAEYFKAGIMSGLYFAGGGGLKQYPQFYALDKRRDDALEKLYLNGVERYPVDGIFEVDAVGAGCMVVHREVLIKMAETFAKTHDGYDNPYKWFQEAVFRGHEFGEDLVFCTRARQLGFKVMVNGQVRFDHEKSDVVNEGTFRQQLVAAGEPDLIHADQVESINDEGVFVESGPIENYSGGATVEPEMAQPIIQMADGGLVLPDGSPAQ